MDSSRLISSQAALGKLCDAVGTARFAQEKTRSEYLSASIELDKWIRRYDLALNAGRNDLVEAAKFQVDRYKTITSKLRPLIIEQDVQTHKLEEQKNQWKQTINHTSNSGSSIDIATESSIELVDVSFNESVFDSTQPEDSFELQKNILVQKKVITELELKILPRQIEYNQTLKSAKTWENRTKEVREWGIKEITQKTDEQFQAFRQKAISLKTYITEQEKLISEANSLLKQYEIQITNSDSAMFSFSHLEENADNELAKMKTKLLGETSQNQAVYDELEDLKKKKLDQL